MSNKDNPMETIEHRLDRDTPASKPNLAEPDGAVVPDAVKEAQTSGRLTKERLAAVRGRGIEWVRASDLLTRGSSTVAGAGIRFNQEAAIRSRRGLANTARAVSKRARELPPLSAFGRRTTPDSAAVRSGVGMR